MKKEFNQLKLLTKIRLYIASAYETHQENKAKTFFAMYGTGITKKFERSWYNPLRWIISKKGVMVVDPQKFFIENPDYFDASDIEIKSTK